MKRLGVVALAAVVIFLLVAATMWSPTSTVSASGKHATPTVEETHESEETPEVTATSEGQGHEPKTLCHREGNGSYHEITVDKDSVTYQAHLGHGDWEVDSDHPCPPRVSSNTPRPPTATPTSVPPTHTPTPTGIVSSVTPMATSAVPTLPPTGRTRTPVGPTRTPTATPRSSLTPTATSTSCAYPSATATATPLTCQSVALATPVSTCDLVGAVATLVASVNSVTPTCPNIVVGGAGGNPGVDPWLIAGIMVVVGLAGAFFGFLGAGFILRRR